MTKTTKTLIGYGRASTTQQTNSTQTQRARFLDLGVDPDLIFIENKSGKSAKDRPALQAMLKTVRKGDHVVVTKVDRLARSMGDLLSILKTITEKGATFEALDQPEANFSSSQGKLLLGILGVVAEFECDLINERRAEGIAKAKAKGVKFGPEPKLSIAQVEDLKADRKVGGLKIKELMAKYELSKASVYRILDGTTKAGEA